ncbi:MAG: hypothetical protein BWY92_01721 [Firmicutes bacterium ADurb.BinA052]|nr:MAG: hypothetical protein BWY92_01721 [Firmicutes bacterium ADurb.BinA052]
MLNGAVIGRHDAVSAMSQIPCDYLPISDSHCVLGLVAIPPWLAHANHGMDHDVIQLAYPLKRIHHALAFHLKLSGIAQVKQLAAAAFTVQDAGGVDPIRRCLQHALKTCPGVAAFHLFHADGDFLAGKCPRHEHGEPIDVTHALAFV